ncbi:class I SAM-dependent methyltransferase [Kribbella sandramycini]|uniref:Class I SAM-dependent methyltransferase n=1 Tax=Kribbella sandramycini TaxID=60450 RepID=A0A7Y4KZI2_9ACTN|nr:class I SAM-dependent methyltransferase [Kribbella sandramycini]MBB6565264.1 ubiquinone/menaquinone biosynthesis C-methylase UbiE [Kribbella sandramycini]NOL41533.1 class I SAM-dependent methyltransferase [Kribbella sandramycini]
MTIHEELEAHYSERYDEAGRLGSTIKGRLELARVQDLLGRYLPPPPATVADIGGGPGVHSRWLRSLGYDVELLDPVPRHVAHAARAGIDATLGDARELPWEDEEFDAVLLAGPMYHLPDARDRRQALREALRVTKYGGFVATIAINRSANLIGSTLANELIKRRSVVTEILRDGHSPDNERLAHANYHTVAQLRAELCHLGLRGVTIHGLTGPGGWLPVVIDAHYNGLPLPDTLRNPDPLTTALECSRLADNYPELVQTSALLFGIGQRD